MQVIDGGMIVIEDSPPNAVLDQAFDNSQIVARDSPPGSEIILSSGFLPVLATMDPLGLAAAPQIGISHRGAREDHVHPWDGLELLVNRGAPNGYAPLDATGRISSDFLPEIPVLDLPAGVAFLDEVQAWTAAQDFTGGLTKNGADVATTAALNAAVAPLAADVSVVHLTGAETITGLKTFVPTTISSIGVAVRALAGQTGNLQEWQNSAGAVTLAVSSTAGKMTGNTTDPFLLLNGSGASLNWQTTQWLVGGPVTYSSAGSIKLRIDSAGQMRVGGSTPAGAQLEVDTSSATLPAAIFKAFASQTADLSQWQDSAGTVLSRATSDGRLGVGGTIGSMLDVITNATGRIGIIVRGVAGQSGDMQQWQSSAGAVYANIFSNGGAQFDMGSNGGVGIRVGAVATTGLTVGAGAAGNIPLVARAFASQTADLQQWQNSGGTWMVRVSAGGQIQAVNPADAGINNRGVNLTGGIFNAESRVWGLHNSSGGLRVGTDNTGGNTGSTTAILFQAGGTGTTKMNFYGGVGGIGANNLLMQLGDTGGFIVNPSGLASASVAGLIVKGTASQTGNLQEWQDSASTVLTKIDSAGAVNFMAGQALRFYRPDGVTLGMSISSGTANNFITANNGALSISAGSFTTQIVAGSSTSIALTLQGAASQSANLQNWQDSTGSKVAQMTQNGALGLNSYLSVQTGSGASIPGDAAAHIGGNNYSGAPVLIVQGTAGQSVDNLQIRNSSSVVMASFTPTGLLSLPLGGATTSTAITMGLAARPKTFGWTSGVSPYDELTLASNGSIGGWHGSIALQTSYSGGALVHGFSVRSTSNGTVITSGPAYAAGTGQFLLATTDAAGRIPLVVQGFSGQSVDLQQFQNSAGTVMAQVSSAGDISSNSFKSGGVGGVGGGTYAIRRASGTTTWQWYSPDDPSLYLRDMVNARMAITANAGPAGTAVGVLNDRWLVKPNSKVATLTTVSLTSNVATFTTSAAHGFLSGRYVVIAGVGAPYDGTYPISTIPSGTTFTIKIINADLGSTATAGTATSQSDGGSNSFEIQDWQSRGLFTVAPLGGVSLVPLPTTAGQIEASGPALNLQSARWTSGANVTENFRLTNIRIGGVAGVGAYNLWFQDNANNVVMAMAGDGSRNVGVGGAQFPQNSSAYGQLTAYNTIASQAGLVVRGAASQSGDLLQLSDSAGTVLARVLSGGGMSVGVGGGQRLNVNGSGLTTTTMSLYPAATSWIGLAIQGLASQASDLFQAQSSTGASLLRITASGDIVIPPTSYNTAGINVPRVYADNANGSTSGTALILAGVAGNPPIIARGAASQTGDLQQWQNSAATVLHSITAGGLPKWGTGTTQTTVGAAGTASALPVLPTKWLKVVDDVGTTLVVPAFAAA